MARYISNDNFYFFGIGKSLIQDQSTGECIFSATRFDDGEEGNVFRIYNAQYRTTGIGYQKNNCFTFGFSSKFPRSIFVFFF